MMLLPPGIQIGLDCAQGTGRVMAGVVNARLCTAFGLLDQARSPLIEDVGDGGVMRGAWLAMASEQAATRSQIGSQALVDSLMKSCILMLLRRYMSRPGINLRIVRALVDPRLGSAVAAILDNPASGHSVESLATSAGLSRSTFARQFANQLGFPPMEFVTRTRLHHAASMLRSSRTPIKSVAAQIGFASRSHFSRAFREIYGVDPKSYRQHSTE
jgi:transcriptional regulator GlxA family with amidase domain